MAAFLRLDASVTLSATSIISMALLTVNDLANPASHKLIRPFRLNLSAMRRSSVEHIGPSGSRFVQKSWSFWQPVSVNKVDHLFDNFGVVTFNGVLIALVLLPAVGVHDSCKDIRLIGQYALVARKQIQPTDYVKISQGLFFKKLFHWSAQIILFLTQLFSILGNDRTGVDDEELALDVEVAIWEILIPVGLKLRAGQEWGEPKPSQVAIGVREGADFISNFDLGFHINAFWLLVHQVDS